MSTFISHGQGRAHANITEFIVSALKLDSFAIADSIKLELIDSSVFIRATTRIPFCKTPIVSEVED